MNPNLIDWRLIGLTLITLFNLAFAFRVLLLNRRGAVNRAYFIFALALVFWALFICSFFWVEDLAAAKLMMQFCYLAAVLIAISFLHFANVFPFRHLKFHPLSLVAASAATLMALLVIFSPSYLVQEVLEIDGIREVTLNQLGHMVFAFYFLTFSVAILYIFIKKYRSSDGLMKMQLKYVGAGCFLTLSLGVFFNLVLPGFGNHHFIWLGPYFTGAVPAFVGYSINLSRKIR